LAGCQRVAPDMRASGCEDAPGCNILVALGH
jgi:hypothetical protein